MRASRAMLAVGLAVSLALAGALSGCATVVIGSPSAATAPPANLTVVGDSGSTLDTTIKNALSDIFAFWKLNYPKIAHGAQFEPIKGGLFSVDGAQVLRDRQASGPAAQEGCIQQDALFIIDNAAYCQVDDSIVWDRSDGHLIQVLSARYGDLLVAEVFAHETGHAIQQRLGIFKNQTLPTIDVESQADCAAGAFLASILKGESAHFRANSVQVDEMLNGYLQVRDSTPTSSAQISHGNGFDRISAIADGLTHGATFCYSPNYFNRQFTERPFLNDNDYISGGNETLSQVLDPNDTKTDPSAGGLQPDLNRFWTSAGQSISKKWTAVKIAQATRPACGASSGSQFGYCPNDNTVYYDKAFAQRAYYSLAQVRLDQNNATVAVVDNQPADFALGTLFAMSWGMSVRHQFFNQPLDSSDALLAAACYTGAYSKDINRASNDDGKHPFLLSPPDMDEATSAMLNLAGLPQAFGARNTTGLQRVQAFVKGYNGGLSVC
jgi:predicted metalloprotease